MAKLDHILLVFLSHEINGENLPAKFLKYNPLKISTYTEWRQNHIPHGFCFLEITVGVDFYFGIPLTPAGQSPRYEVLIGTPSNEADYVVESSEGVIASGTAMSISPDVVRIDDAFQVISSAFSERMKGVKVYASGENPIYILVIIKYNFFGNFQQVVGYGSFPIHRNTENNDTDTYVYYAISTDYNGDPTATNQRSSILLIGNYENTSVSITPTQNISLPQDAQDDSSQVEVAAGTTHTVTLHSLQTLGFSNLLDLTGTKIVSDKPLTVITGHQCARVPSDIGFCEPTYVHLPPVFNWGQEFLLAPFAGRTANQQYKLVTSVNSTFVEYRCGTQATQRIEVVGAGNGHLLVIPNNSYCFLVSSYPIFVVQIAPGFGTDNAGDTAIAAVAPISGHVSDTEFASIPSDFPDNFITVTVEAQHFDASEIQLDGNTLNCTWTDIYHTVNNDIVGRGCTFLLSDNVTHNVSHLGENGTLSVVVYGWNTQFAHGYAYLTNFNLQPLNGKNGVW